jgi:carbamoyltransferase
MNNMKKILRMGGFFMNDGYYLSTYLCIDDIGHLITLDQRHDFNIALFKKENNTIELIHYWELERVSRIKHHGRAFYNPEHALNVINDLLSKYHITMDDIEEVWGTPHIQTSDDYHSIKEYPHLMFHSVSHLFSGILYNTDIFNNEEILALALDGGPDSIIQTTTNKNYFTGCYTRKGNIVDLFPVDSPGSLWSFACNYFKMREGSLMALASASTSEAFFPYKDTLRMKDSKTIMDAMNYFESLVKMVENLKPGDAGILFNSFDNRFSIEENKISMVMKEIQKMSIRIIEKNIESIIKKHSIDPKNTYLCMTGGYALNCPTNSHLIQKYKFKGFIAPPCVNDGGISLGMGLYAFYKKMFPSKLNFKLNHAFYGDKDETEYKITSNNTFNNYIKSVEELSLEKIAEDLTKFPIVWFNGRAELGPRALGNRSLLGDPRNNKTKKYLNELKQRQWWRPVAPIILENEIKEWFKNSYPSPYMLHTFRIIPGKVSVVPAIVHLDGSARVQTVNIKTNPLLYCPQPASLSD